MQASGLTHRVEGIGFKDAVLKKPFVARTVEGLASFCGRTFEVVKDDSSSSEVLVRLKSEPSRWRYLALVIKLTVLLPLTLIACVIKFFMRRGVSFKVVQNQPLTVKPAQGAEEAFFQVSLTPRSVKSAPLKDNGDAATPLSPISVRSAPVSFSDDSEGDKSVGITLLDEGNSSSLRMVPGSYAVYEITTGCERADDAEGQPCSLNAEAARAGVLTEDVPQVRETEASVREIGKMSILPQVDFVMRKILFHDLIKAWNSTGLTDVIDQVKREILTLVLMQNSAYDLIQQKALSPEEVERLQVTTEKMIDTFNDCVRTFNEMSCQSNVYKPLATVREEILKCVALAKAMGEVRDDKTQDRFKGHSLLPLPQEAMIEECDDVRTVRLNAKECAARMLEGQPVYFPGASIDSSNPTAVFERVLNSELRRVLEAKFASALQNENANQDGGAFFQFTQGLLNGVPVTGVTFLGNDAASAASHIQVQSSGQDEGDVLDLGAASAASAGQADPRFQQFEALCR